MCMQVNWRTTSTVIKSLCDYFWVHVSLCILSFIRTETRSWLEVSKKICLPCPSRKSWCFTFDKKLRNNKRTKQGFFIFVREMQSDLWHGGKAQLLENPGWMSAAHLWAYILFSNELKKKNHVCGSHRNMTFHFKQKEANDNDHENTNYKMDSMTHQPQRQHEKTKWGRGKKT